MDGHDGDCACDNCVSINLCLNENQKKEKEAAYIERMFEEQYPASQVLSSSDDDGPEQDGDEIDLVTPPRAPKKAAGKRPLTARRFLDLAAEEEDADVPPSSEEADSDVNMVEQVWPPVKSKKRREEPESFDDTPDLEAYFRQKKFAHVSNFTKISHCRTYANYLAQVEKAKKESNAKKRSKKE